MIDYKPYGFEGLFILNRSSVKGPASRSPPRPRSRFGLRLQERAGGPIASGVLALCGQDTMARNKSAPLNLCSPTWLDGRNRLTRKLQFRLHVRSGLTFRSCAATRRIVVFPGRSRDALKPGEQERAARLRLTQRDCAFNVRQCSTWVRGRDWWSWSRERERGTNVRCIWEQHLG